MRQNLSTLARLFALVSLPWLGGSPCFAEQKTDVTVEKSAPTVERREFFPWNPFGPRPNLGPGQKALTEYSYKLGVKLGDVDILDQEERHGRWFVHVQPKDIIVRLSLPIVIWTPQGAPQKCLLHEDGHRIIVERIYEFAGDIVKHYAEEMLSSNYYGEGGTLEQAVKDGYKRATTELNKQFRDTVFEYARLVTAEYDRITNHGLNPIGEEEAINQAFDKCSSEMARILEAKADPAEKRDTTQGPVTKLDGTSNNATQVNQTKPENKTEENRIK